MSLLKKNTKQSKANKQQKNEPKLNYEMQREIEDAFSFYDPKKTKQINRDNLKCILGNFGFQQAAASQIDQFL
jgi:Ca2+-binding EF-hand superfamily protein